MIEHELAIAIGAVVLLLIIILIILKARKRISKKAKPAIDYRTPGLAKQSQKIKPDNEPVIQTGLKNKPSGKPKTDEPVFHADPQNAEAIQPVEPVFDADPSIEPQTNKTAAPVPENRYKNLPQDSMLRRHFLTNVQAMIESLKSPRPADSVLSDDYDAMISAEMDQCLSDEAAMERLVCQYEEHKKTLVQQIQKPEVIAEPVIEPVETGIKQEKLKLPEDSMLRRHYLTHLRALIESRLPPRPTDSTLRRHYDSMIENEVKNLL